MSSPRIEQPQTHECTSEHDAMDSVACEFGDGDPYDPEIPGDSVAGGDPGLAAILNDRAALIDLMKMFD